MVDRSHINDIRTLGQFSGITFSNYKKTEVRTKLLDCFAKGKLEPACHWTAEFVCAGHYRDIWEIFVYFVAKYVHLANPKVLIYLQKRHAMFTAIANNGRVITELDLRNEPEIRRLFAEVVCVLCLTPKKPAVEPIKIKRVEEFDITQMTDRLKAPHVGFLEGIYQKEDAKELFIAMNELAFHVSPESRNMVNAAYWVEWVIDFDLVCKRRKEPCKCASRSQVPVDAKFRSDPIWVVWEIFQSRIKQGDSSQLVACAMKALFQLFCSKYSQGAAKKRRPLLYFAISLLTEPLSETAASAMLIPTASRDSVDYVIQQIDAVYRQIKENEENPNTDYLFKNLNEKTANLHQSLKRMDMLSSLDAGMNASSITA